ncbi:MAG: hypothetical protein KBS81_11740, partial [Spirochaetales bacterium]|nr:hypothetical protein [Candidatus Physcosoma equi]
MAKSPEVTIELKKLEDILLKSSPVAEIIPIRIKVSFPDLPEGAVKDLEEFANVEDGSLERWLLVPDSISLGALGFVVEKAFGLLPDPASDVFTMGDEDWTRLVPDMGTFLKACGRLFDPPMDVPDLSALTDMSISSKLMMAPLLLSMMFTSCISYQDAQKEMRKQFAAYEKDGVIMDGQHYTLEEAPTDLEFFYDKVATPDDFGLTDGLCPDLELREVLQTEGKKLYDMKDVRKEKRKPGLYERKNVKPIVHTLHMLKYDEEDYIAYDFEITRPKNVYSLIEDGCLSVEDYLES